MWQSHDNKGEIADFAQLDEQLSREELPPSLDERPLFRALLSAARIEPYLLLVNALDRTPLFARVNRWKRERIHLVALVSKIGDEPLNVWFVSVVHKLDQLSARHIGSRRKLVKKVLVSPDDAEIERHEDPRFRPSSWRKRRRRLGLSSSDGVSLHARIRLNWLYHCSNTGTLL